MCRSIGYRVVSVGALLHDGGFGGPALSAAMDEDLAMFFPIPRKSATQASHSVENFRKYDFRVNFWKSRPVGRLFLLFVASGIQVSDVC